jgi:class 3 adenylate cyclase
LGIASGTPPSSSSAGPPVVLVGRDAELSAIREALAGARLGKSARLVIRGEPGIGKSAMLDRAVAEGQSMRLLSARGVEFEAGVPFAGLHELLAPVLGLLDRLPPIHAAALRSSLGLGERNESDRLIVGAATLELLSAYAEETPLLITLDDAQWLDRASAEAIAFAARRLLADPIAILIAIREGEDSPLLAAGLPEMSLGGLDEQSARLLLGPARPIPDEQMHQLVSSTGGNPLAMLELGRDMTQIAWPSHESLPVTTTVERAYLRRVEGLPAGARRALVLLAASGGIEPGPVRKAAAELDLQPSDVDEAESARGLVVERADSVEFVHPLARAAIYHAAAPAERRAVHRALAGVMSRPDQADRRAWHLAAGAAGWDAEAASELEQAATRARESSGYAAAANAWAESARLTEQPDLRATRLFNAAENAWLGGLAQLSLDSIDSARTLANTIELRADIDTLSGSIAMRRGAVIEGYRTMVAAAETIEGLDRLKAIRILSDAAITTFGAGNAGEMLTISRRSLDLLRDGDPPETSVFAKVAYGAVAILAGQGSDGPRHLRECVALFEEIPQDSRDPLLVTCAGMVGLFLREAQAGRDLFERALEQARTQAPTAALPAVLFMLGRDAAATDRWQLARAQYEEGIRVARETTQLFLAAGALAGLAWLDALEGREQECLSHAAEALELSEQYQMGFYKSWALIALGQIELGLGRPERALENLESCAQFLTSISITDPDLSPAPDIVDALVRLGRHEDARRVAADYSASAAAKGQPFALARAARARALIAADSSFEAEFEDALRHHRDTPDLFELARTHLYYGERLRRTRKRIAARHHLREALKVFDRLGAAPWAQRALGELQASGETARVRDDTSRMHLTPQELQVALALAEGKTTRETAARLFLSPKTVEYHLRHVYDKLEIRSRDELRKKLLGQSAPTAIALALMFTDVAHSTPLVEAIGDRAWRDLSNWVDGELRRCFSENNGREVDHAGDGFFVVFDSAGDAIACATTIQRRLAAHRRVHGFAPGIRIGIHFGEVEAEGKSIRGAAVHQAARLCAAADPDAILVSREALEAGGRPIQDMTRMSLKGIRSDVEATEVAWDQ